MKKIVIIAPHPDDETLGCGGTILKHLSNGDEVYWIIMTSINGVKGYTKEKIKDRESQIDVVSELYKFKKTFKLDYPVSSLDSVPFENIINSISEVFNLIKPEIIYIPYGKDAHSDHRVTYECAMACTKPFRYPFIKSVRIYQTLSETVFGEQDSQKGFLPNLFIDISDFLNKKIEIMKIYSDEILPHPFPRSELSIKSLAYLWGSSINTESAEAFISIREIK